MNSPKPVHPFLIQQLVLRARNGRALLFSMDLLDSEKHNGQDLSDPTPISPTCGTWPLLTDSPQISGTSGTSFSTTLSGTPSSLQQNHGLVLSATSPYPTSIDESVGSLGVCHASFLLILTVFWVICILLLIAIGVAKISQL